MISFREANETGVIKEVAENTATPQRKSFREASALTPQKTSEVEKPRTSTLSEMLNEPEMAESAEPVVDKKMNSMIAARELEAKGVPQDSFLKRFGQNLVEAPKAFTRTIASVGSPFGGKQIGEAIQATAVGAKGLFEMEASQEVFNEQMQKIQADPNIKPSQKQEARRILSEGLANLEQDYKTKFEGDAPSKAQVMADIAEAGIDLATLGLGSKAKVGLKSAAGMFGTGVVSGATGAFSETGEVKSALIGGTAAAILGGIPLIGDVTASFAGKKKIAQEQADAAVKQILNLGKKQKDKIEKAAAGLAQIDTKGANTYSDLLESAVSKQQAVFDAQTKYLSEIPGVITKDQATRKIGDNAVDYIEESLNDMIEVYTKEGAFELAEEMSAVLQKYQSSGLSFVEANNVAKAYGGAFKNSTFTKAGEMKSSITAARHENIRKGVKNTFRDLLPDDKSKVLDKKASELYQTVDALDNMDRKVENLLNQVQKRGILDRVGNKLQGVLDIATLGMLGGFIRAAVPSNSGGKMLNSLALQDLISNNIKLIDKAARAKSDGAMMNAIVKIVESVPPAVRQQLIKAGAKEEATNQEELSQE